MTRFHPHTHTALQTLPVSRSFSRMIVPLICIAMLPLLFGCQYERVVARSSLISGLEGSSSTIPEIDSRSKLPDVLRTPFEGIRIEHEDGSITLAAKSLQQLMTHITTTIQNNEKDLFVEQVLCELTKEEFYERGLDPGLAFEELIRRQKSIFRLFYFMPMGDYTPGLIMENVGRNTFRLQVSRARNPDLYWIGIDTVFENGNYRLRWFVP